MNNLTSTAYAYGGNEPYIFVSYSHKDADTVIPAIAEMQKNGFRVWFDLGIEVGTEWSNNIASHLRDCSVFVAFVSKNSVKSENCLDEIAFAKSNQKPSLLIFLEENVSLPEGTEMQTARFQRMFYCRQKSNAEFIKNICAASIFDPCRESEPAPVGAYSAPVPPSNAPKNAPQSPKKPFNTKLLIGIGFGAAALIIILLLVLLLGKDKPDSSAESSLAADESVSESVEVSEESKEEPKEIVMSDTLLDCTFKLEGALYQLPCDIDAFTKNGWTISSSDYSSDKLINGNATDGFTMMRDGKKITVAILNLSGNMMPLADCPVIGIEVSREYGASIELAKGITLSNSTDEIAAAYGTPTYRDSYDSREILAYENQSLFASVEFCVYNEDMADYTRVELLRYAFDEIPTTETNTQAPDFLGDYTQPDELGSDVLSGNFALDGKAYRLPAPVKAFLDNGWTIASAPESVAAGGKAEISIKKDGATVELKIKNLASYQTIAENCLATSISVNSTDKAVLQLPNGINFGSTPNEIDVLLPDSFAKNESNYSTSYSYSDKKLYIYLYVDTEDRLLHRITLSDYTLN